MVTRLKTRELATLLIFAKAFASLSAATAGSTLALTAAFSCALAMLPRCTAPIFVAACCCLSSRRRCSSSCCCCALRRHRLCLPRTCAWILFAAAKRSATIAEVISATQPQRRRSLHTHIPSCSPRTTDSSSESPAQSSTGDPCPELSKSPAVAAPP